MMEVVDSVTVVSQGLPIKGKTWQTIYSKLAKSTKIIHQTLNLKTVKYPTELSLPDC